MISDLNKEKLEAVNKMYGMRIYRICMEILEDIFDAEDAAQDAYIKILHYIDRIDDISAASAQKYISLAAESAAKNMLRKDKRKRSGELIFLSDETADEALEAETAKMYLEEVHALGVCVDRLAEYKGALSEDDLAALKYYTEGSRTLKETAEHFGMTHAALRKRVQRLRARVSEIHKM